MNETFTKETMEALRELPCCPTPTAEDKTYCWHLDHRNTGREPSVYLIERTSTEGDVDETWACATHAESYCGLNENTLVLRVIRLKGVN